MIRKKYVLFTTLFVCFIFFFIIYQLSKSLIQIEPKIIRSGIEKAIYSELENLPYIYTNPKHSISLHAHLDKILENLIVNKDINTVPLEQLWVEANSWIHNKQLTNISSVNLGKLLHSMKTANIIDADLDPRGTQLKFLFTLVGRQKVIFKPKWYEKEKLINGEVYAGKDRYQAEIIAFYLSILLGKPLVPLCTERVVSLKYEVLPVATQKLINTSFERDGRKCVYGKCYYCNKHDPICDKEYDFLTGAVIFNIDKSFIHYPSPWQRSYKKGVKSRWEKNSDYCQIVKTKIPNEIILDLIDTAIFDFLMQNGDRHHYETIDDERVIWIDNGKGLGNPYVNHIDILAPLYQCCMLRNETKQKLIDLSGGNLRKFLRRMPNIDDFLTEAHLNSLEYRLQLIFATIEFCKNKLNAKL